jgi:thiol-disulfide isomerase/thioredoxin
MLLALVLLPPVGCACFLLRRRVFWVVLFVVRVAMTRRFPSTVLIVAAVLAAVVLGGGAALVHYRSRIQDGALPLAGTVAHFSLSTPRLPAPAVSVGDTDGNTLALPSSLNGQVTLVNFWATWCIPCLKEMPSLDRLQGELGGQDFSVMAVSIDRGGKDTAMPWLERNGIHQLKPYFDPESRAAFAFKATELPVSVLIDREGRVVGRMVGPAEWDAPEAKALIAALIAEKS